MSTLRERIYSHVFHPEALKAKVEAHTPRIEAPQVVKAGELFDVRVFVNHPMSEEHRIEWIEVYALEDGVETPRLLARFEPRPGVEPSISIRVSLQRSAHLVAVAYCNLHGLWESSVRVEVEKG